jgi:hypothetical protein
MSCYQILNVNLPCKNCGTPLTTDELDRNMKMDGLQPLCFQCINKLY